ncbi:DNA repair and recombination protein PIF1 [Gymnopus androsaceus JB14]|uniref:DNA repair and recombination protein PIF1 n=1 Tax=Gymnopus androsaceus JB14 TaxID=1447944 RepID=A0A6A4GMQ1_9AGAR|nr:DNA repair and recombination protein PIF1 [Gymnopus androsaceus JB14]
MIIGVHVPFILERQQFPVCLAFAMSIHKLQGQSVKQVGLNLQSPVYTHGQFYVTLSNSTTKQGVKVIFPEGKYISCFVFLNIVYPEVLLDPVVAQ